MMDLEDILDEKEAARLLHIRSRRDEGEENGDNLFHDGLCFLLSMNWKDFDLDKAKSCFRRSKHKDAGYFLSVIEHEEGLPLPDDGFATGMHEFKFHEALRERRQEVLDRFSKADPRGEFVVLISQSHFIPKDNRIESSFCCSAALWTDFNLEQLMKMSCPFALERICSHYKESDLEKWVEFASIGAKHFHWIDMQRDLAHYFYQRSIDLAQAIYGSGRYLNMGVVMNDKVFCPILHQIMLPYNDREEEGLCLELVYRIGEAVYFDVLHSLAWEHDLEFDRVNKQLCLLALDVFVKWRNKVQKAALFAAFAFANLLGRGLSGAIGRLVYRTRYDEEWHTPVKRQKIRVGKKRRKDPGHRDPR
jgi:hypothetical protein